MRRLLHRALDFVAHPRHAAGQTGGRAMRATSARSTLRAFWPPRTAGGLRQPAPHPGNVRHEPRPRPRLSDRLGATNRTLIFGQVETQTRPDFIPITRKNWNLITGVLT